VEIDGRISQANGRLKSSKVGIAIERRGNRLWLRGTLPPKPGSGKEKPYRQKISLGVRATPAGVQHAEKQARLLGAELNLGRFDWVNWADNEFESKSGILSAEWIRRFEADYWLRRERNQQSETTWRTDYRVILNKLPADELLSPELLLSVINDIPPDSRQRKRAVQVCSALAKFAGMQTDFSNLIGSYSPKRVNPRFLPSDAAIVEARNSISNEAWRWVLGVIACYGLRPHEAFHLEMSEFPVLEVGDATKTGGRIVYPLYPEWAEQWELEKVKLPNFQKAHSNAVLGTNVSDAFRRREIPFHAYDLRHCYARRCFEFSLPPDLAAGLMGHSIQIHMNTYRAWIDKATYRRAYDALINRADRPAPPSQTLL
jgi:integrase